MQISWQTSARPAAALASLLALAGGAVAAPQRPFPQHVDYGVGTILPTPYTRAQLDSHVRDYYAVWKVRYVVAAGSDAQGQPMHRIAFGKPGTVKHAITVSEGQGWGMVVLPLLAGHDPQAQTIFDGLLRYARAFPSIVDARLMAWYIRNGVALKGKDSAFDGDADIGYGLLLAHRQWGSAGTIDYGTAARQRIAAVLASTIGQNSRLPLLGDWVDDNGNEYNQWTNRPSDYMPASFQAFRTFTGVAGWAGVTTRTRQAIDFLQTTYSAGKGLVPDFVEPVSATNHTARPADPGFLEGPADGAYAFNACRVPMRIGLDALHHKHALSIAAVDRITRWARTATSGDPARVRAGYRLDGAPLAGSNYFSAAFVAPLGVAAMSVPSHQAWLSAVYDAVRQTHQGYYEDTITLLSLLIMSGNFWNPGGS